MNHNARATLNILGLAITAALLSACGGGGGGSNPVRPDGPPPPPPPPQICQDPDATNTGGPLPCVYPPPPSRYSGPEDSPLVPINADLAHEEGFTGKGVKVGAFDSFDESTLHKYAPLIGKIDYVENMPSLSSSINKNDTHGMRVSAILLGNPFAEFKGGVAPGARLYAYNAFTEETGVSSRPQGMIEQGVRLFNRSVAMLDIFNSDAHKTAYIKDLAHHRI